MKKRWVKRIFIFLLFPALIAIPVFAEDVIVKVIGGLLTFIYVALLIFLRDSFRARNFDYDESGLEQALREQAAQGGDDDSFKIVGKTSSEDIITDESYYPVKSGRKTTMLTPENSERFREIANEEIPQGVGDDGQFSFVLEKLLHVIKESFQAYSTVFFWYNKKRHRLSVDKFVSNSQEIQPGKYPVEDDVLSKIVNTGEPEILSDILSSAEEDVIRYYATPQRIKSFVGVPIFYDKHMIAVLALDSRMQNAYGIETIFSLGRFVRLITILINLFEEKYSESISQQRLKGLLYLLNPAPKTQSEEDFILGLEKSIEFLIPFDAYTFVILDPLNNRFVTFRVVNKTSLKFVGENLEVDIEGTITGQCLDTGIPVKIDDTSADDYKRFSQVEDPGFGGSFVAIPLVYKENTYGAICLECLKKNVYANQDVRFLQNSISILSYIMYSFVYQKKLKNLITIDPETRALSINTFKARLETDLIRAYELKIPGSLAIIELDDFQEQKSLFEGENFSKVVFEISKLIAAEINHFNIFGRLADRQFAVYFFNSTSKDVYLWAEKVRKKIARQAIPIFSRQTSFTVSIGVASTNGKTETEEVLDNALLALDKAAEKGGNKVRNIN